MILLTHHCPDDPNSLMILWKTDPFLYHSIPEIHKAELAIKEVDYSQASQSASHVSRKARVSYEGHTLLVMDDFENEMDGLEYESLGDIDDILTKLYFDALK